MNHYLATLRFEDFRSLRNLTQVFRQDRFVAEREILAPNRRAAVRKALQWFSTRFKGSVGPACQVLTVDDPSHEVTYDRDFSCRDLRNKLLPEEVVERLIAEANGELIRDTRHSKLGHPLCAVRRRKRRVKFKAKAIAPCVYQNACGTIFYRVNRESQLSKSGVVLRKRHTQLVRLAARTLPEAIQEIEARGLLALHQSRRAVKKRSLDVLLQLATAPTAGPHSGRPHGNGSGGPDVTALLRSKGTATDSPRAHGPTSSVEASRRSPSDAVTER